MPRLVLANTATAEYRRSYFDLRATDGLTAVTSEAAGQPQISTDGGAWTNTGIGTLTHIGNGRYYADLTQAAIATAGLVISTRYKSASTVETPGDTFQVVGFNPNDSIRMGLTSLPAATPATSGGLPIIGTGANAISTDGAGNVNTAVQKWLTAAPNALASGNVQVSVAAMQPTVVTATSIATDAITNSKIAAGAIDNAQLIATTSIENAVWNAVRASHSTSGTFGQGVASVQGNVTGNVSGSVATVAAGVTVSTNNDKTGYTVAVGGIDASAFAANAVDSAALAQSASQEIADEVLNRDIAGGSSGGARNVRNALRSLRNKTAISAGTLTVYQEDDTSSAWTAAVTTAAGDPIASVDPT